MIKVMAFNLIVVLVREKDIYLSDEESRIESFKEELKWKYYFFQTFMGLLKI